MKRAAAFPCVRGCPLSRGIRHCAMKYRLNDSLGYRLSRVARIQERSLRMLGLTRTTWCVLLAVGNEGLSQPSDIAEFIGIDRTATSRALRQMEAGGLIVRAAGDRDGRTRRVRLTAIVVFSTLLAFATQTTAPMTIQEGSLFFLRVFFGANMA